MQVNYAEIVLNSSVYCLLIVAMFMHLHKRTDCVHYANSKECSRVCVFHSFSAELDPVRRFCQGFVHSEDDSCIYVRKYKLISGE